MKVNEVSIDRVKARELYRVYKKHQHYSAPIDHDIQRAYQLIAQGRMVIRALNSIVTAGLGEDGFPKLALANATHKAVRCELDNAGVCTFYQPRGWRGRNHQDKRNTFVVSGLKRTTPMKEFRESAEAIVPLVPLHLRPKRGLASYHVLWEAVWKRVPPRDPMLLRRIGGDLWLVVAAWDLTEVERAAMSRRVSA